MVEEVFGSGENTLATVWQAEIDTAMAGSREIYTDGSKEKGARGMMGGGWFEPGGIQGSVTVGGTATVWVGEIAGIKVALEATGDGHKLLILTDSKVAIAAIKRAGQQGKAKTTDLRQIVNMIARRECHGGRGTI